MIINYGSPAYLASLLFIAAVIAVIFALVHGCSESTKRTVVFSIMMINLIQHFFKFLIWPQHYGESFNLVNTAYNVCAFLIILSPFALLTGNRLLKEFISVTGTAGGFMAIAVPVWFIGQTPFQWEFARSLACHTMLAASSLLMPLFGLVKFRYRSAPYHGLLFLGMLALILLNDVVVLLPTTGREGLMAELMSRNPLWMMAPPNAFGFLVDIFEACSPPIFLPNGSHGYIPILWYALPMYVLYTVGWLLLFGIADRKTFLSDLGAVRGLPAPAKFLPVQQKSSPVMR